MPGQWRWTRRDDAARSTRGSRAPRHLVAAPDVAAGVGSEALDELLGEVRELRLTFIADLSTAASAVEAGAPEIASDIVGADRRELARFFRVADDQLRELERAAYRPEPATETASARPASRMRRRVAVAVPAIPLVGALTMAAAAAAGVLPVPGISHGQSHRPATVVVGDVPALQQLETVVNSDPSAQQVIAAADKLHQQIVALIATSGGDPARADAIAQLLQMERALLLSKRPPGAQAVLAATRSLITQLASHANAVVTPVAPKPTPAHISAPAPSTASKPASGKPSPSPSKTAKPTPKPTQSSSPSPSPTPSSSNSSGPLPKVGG
jgi:hypothetical protein